MEIGSIVIGIFMIGLVVVGIIAWHNFKQSRKEEAELDNVIVEDTWNVDKKSKKHIEILKRTTPEQDRISILENKVRLQRNAMISYVVYESIKDLTNNIKR